MIEFEEFRDLLKSDRTVRRFKQEFPVSDNMLRQLVELTRYCASGRNAQPLRYRLVHDPKECEALFPALAWAGYFKEWPGPEEGERPSAYLVQCLDTDFGPNCLCDDGLQLQAITLGATTLGLGCCIIKAFDPKMVSQALTLPANMQPRYVLAMGIPAEHVVVETMKSPDDSFEYWRDEEQVHHVPKRPLSELVIEP